MTITKLIEELKKCPDLNAEVEYRNVEIGNTRTIDEVIIMYNKDYLPRFRYMVILD